MDDSGNGVAFSPSDTKLIVAMIAHLNNGKIDTDWDKVAITAGYKDAASAQSRFRRIRAQKLKLSADGTSGKAQPKSAADPPAKLGRAGKSGKGSSDATSKRSKSGQGSTTAGNEGKVESKPIAEYKIKAEESDEGKNVV